MCQSKAEGGIRCSSHAVEALQKHADKQIALVKEYAKENGIALQEESNMYNSFEHSAAVSVKVQEKKAYNKAHNAYAHTRQDEDEVEFQLQSVAGYRNPSSIADYLWKRDSEAKEVLAKRDAAWEAGDNAEANKQIAKLKALRAKTVADAENIVKIVSERGAHNLVDNLRAQNRTPAYLAEVQKKNEEAKANFNKVRKELTEAEKQRFISKRFRNTQEFKQIATSIDFRKRPEVREWEAKQKDLQKDYSMTSEYRQKLEDLASFHPVGSEEHEKIQSHIRKTEILKELTIRKNKREAVQAVESVDS